MQKLPQHIAIIMDGNGRWAKQRGLPRMSGHKAGADTVRKITEYCSSLKEIKVLTLWAFSTENWNRPTEEVNYLMDLFVLNLKREGRRLHRNGIRLRIIGNKEQLPIKLQQAIKEIEELTVANVGLQLVMAINYSGRWDLLQATQKLAGKVLDGIIKPDNITAEDIRAELCLADVPEPDLCIRTSGEVRISNFFLWQLAYTELYFTEVFWPDFSATELDKALAVYARRERRFGTIK
jgi:undecaprenyl diphosphate synthase